MALLDHTIVPARDKEASARFFADMFGLEYNGPERRSIRGQNRDAFRSAHVGDLGWTIGTVTSAMVLDPEAFDELAARVRRRVL